jgi:murein DD-endopeptidase MepM/ murein hydrolase activator NlpD
VLSHPGAKVATFYTHLDKLLVTPTARGESKQQVRAGQVIGIVGFSPLDPQKLKHLLCAAAHKRCYGERLVMRS